MSHWLVEAVRLRESLWGPLADDAEIRALRARELPLEKALAQRAELLAERDGLVEAVRSWRSGANVAALLLGLIAVVIGSSTAAAALGDAAGPVNLLWAVSGLLGLHALTFFLWLGGLAWSLATGASTGGALGKLWLALARRAARGPAAALAPQALMNLMARARLLPWLLGAVSHGFWLLALGAALITLLAMLATRRYDFVWETTILDPGYVERLALWLGSVPGMLGLPTPDAALVRASDGLATQPPEGRAVWAAWLLGVVAVYGVVPRALALFACVWRVRRGVSKLVLDASLPGLDTIEARLRPASRRTGVIDPAPEELGSGTGSVGRIPAGIGQSHPLARSGSEDAMNQGGHADDPTSASGHGEVSPAAPTASGQAWTVAIELPEDLRSSAGRATAASVYDAGVIDSGPQRESAIERLHAARPARLLIVCDARQTADRGTVSLATELAGLAVESRILLAGSAAASASRRQAWVDRLAASGLNDAIADSEIEAWAWLATGDAQSSAQAAIAAQTTPPTLPPTTPPTSSPAALP